MSPETLPASAVPQAETPHQLARHALNTLLGKGLDPTPFNFSLHYGDGSLTPTRLLAQACAAFNGLLMEHPQLQVELGELTNRLADPACAPEHAEIHLETIQSKKLQWLTEIFQLRHALRTGVAEFQRDGNLAQGRLFEQLEHARELHGMLSGIQDAGTDLTPQELRQVMAIAISKNQQVAQSGRILSRALAHALQSTQTLLERIDALEQAAHGHQQEADTDSLTQVLNRRGLERKLRTRTTPAIVLALDLDHFKRLNDTYGHPAGDAVLREVARVLQGQGREGDLVARFGGEEFMLVLNTTSADAGYRIAERLRTHLARHPFHLPNGITERVTASLGVALWTPPKMAFDTAYQQADQALYAAKQAGRNRVITRWELGPSA